MRKIALICMIILFIANKAMAQEAQKDEMIELATLVSETNMEVENWQVTLKEHMDRKKIEKIVKELKNDYLVTTKEDENSIKYLFGDVHKSEGIVESYNVVLPKNTAFQAELVVVLKGSAWSDVVEGQYREKIATLTSHFFTENVKLFACLTTSSDGIMKSDYFLPELTEKLRLQHIKTQTDNVESSAHKKIIYGYTPLWEQKITVMDTPTNLQITVKLDGEDNIYYMIGTPILINEY